MIILLALTHCLGQTINRTLYLVEGELYKQSLPELFSDTIDKQYTFLDQQSKGFQIDDSNLKQLPLVGKYALNPTNIISQKQYKNVNDYQGNKQYGILQEYETGKFQICYNFDISKLDMDYCIQLDETHTGYDFTFLDFGSVAVSSINNNQYIVTIYQGNTQKTQYTFQSTVFDQSVNSIQIDQMIYNGDKYLLVVGIYPTTQIHVPIDVLKIQQDGTIINTSFVINIRDIVQKQGLANIQDIKGCDNGTVFIQVTNTSDHIVYQVQIQQDKWNLQYEFYYQNNIGFDLGYSNLEGNSYSSFIFVQMTSYRLQLRSFVQYIQKDYQQGVSQSATFKFTQNYLIILQDNQLIINNFQNNIQKLNDLKAQILAIDVDSLNDILIVFTTTDIRKYQLQDIYLTYQDLRTDALDSVIIKNGQQMATIKFQVLSKTDYKLYQVSSPIYDIYYNYMYSSQPYKIPQFVSGYNPVLEVTTDKQLLVDLEKYKILDVQHDNEKSIQSQIIMSDGLTGLFKQYGNYSFAIFSCRQYANQQCIEIKVFNDKYKEKVKLYTLQQGTDLGYLIKVGDKIDIYRRDYQSSTIQEFQVINDVIVTDKIYVVYSSYIKVYTYPYGVEVGKIESQNTGINDPIRIWSNTLFNNYIFILSQTGQLVIGQYTNQFYKTQQIKLDSTDVDISIITKDKIIISQKVNNNYDVSLYQTIDGQIVKLYALDLHGYSIQDYILQKDFQNGKVGIYAQLNDEKALLLFGYTQLQRDQLQSIIQLDKDIGSLSVCGNRDQTHILQSYKSRPDYTLIYAYYGYYYMNVAVNSKYFTSQFSQLFPITYQYSNSQNKISIQNFIAYEYNFYVINGSKIDNVEYKSNENQLAIELPQNLFTGQVQQIKTSYGIYVKFETRIKESKQIKTFGMNAKCQQVPKYERIICISLNTITYHKYDGELIQKLDSIPIAAKLTINKDNLSALLVSFQEVSLIKVSSLQLVLFPKTINLGKNLGDIIFYKNWIVNYEDDQLEYYLVKTDNEFVIEKQNQIEISFISKFDYHPRSQSIYYTQFTNSKLSYIKSSLEKVTLDIGQTTQFDVESYLNKNEIYVVDLALNYLKVFDNTVMISSTYGHLYTFNLDDLKLINLYIITGPSAYIYDVKIQDQYVIVKGSNYLSLYKNTGDWSINRPYLSLEASPVYFSDCIALYKQNDVVNMLYTDSSFYVANSIIDDRLILKITNLQQDVPSALFVSAYNGYSLEVIYFNTVKIDVQGDSSDTKWIILFAILGTVVIVGIGWYIYKKKKSQTHDTLL